MTVSESSLRRPTADLRDLRLLAAAAVVGAGALIVAMDWWPTPLNRNILTVPAAERLPSTLVHGTVAGLAVLSLAGRSRWLRVWVPVWFGLVLTSGVLNWWVPYLVGRYPGEITPTVFADEYADNVRVLPRLLDHPVVPDVQHMSIHALLAASCVLTGAIVVREWRSRAV